MKKPAPPDGDRLGERASRVNWCLPKPAYFYFTVRKDGDELKRLFALLFGLTLVGVLVGLPALLLMGQGIAEAMPTGAPGLAVLDQHSPSKPATVNPTNEPTPAALLCRVTTGIQNGRANVRACGSVGCAVLVVALEGDTLEVITLGEWHEVKTGDNTTGFIFSDLCKGQSHD